MKVEQLAEIGSIPAEKGGKSMLDLVEVLSAARAKQLPLIWLLDEQVISSGTVTYLLEFMRMGFVTHLALTGKAMIEDAELAKLGKTAEDLKAAPESLTTVYTLINTVITSASAHEVGIGKAVGLWLQKAPHKDKSLLATAYGLKVPVTVHLALGTESISRQENFDGTAVGKSGAVDFKKLCYAITKLEKGGIVVNMGDTQMLPDLFHTAYAVAQNLGIIVQNVTLATFSTTAADLWRGTPVKKIIPFTGQYEFLLPALHRLLFLDLTKKNEPYQTKEMLTNEFPEPAIRGEEQ